MAQTAYIFGALHKAVFFEEDKPYILDSGKDSEPMPLTGYEWSQLRAVQAEYYEEEYDNILSLKKRTEEYGAKENALEMALELMDTSFSEEYRTEVARELALLIENEVLYTFIRNRLLTTPVPQSFFPETGYATISPFSVKGAELYNDLHNKTEKFGLFYTYLKLGLNLDEHAQNKIDQLLTDSGTYTEFSEALYKNSDKQFDSAIISATTKLKRTGVNIAPGLLIGIKERLGRDHNMRLSVGNIYETADVAEAEIRYGSDPITAMIEQYFEEKETKQEKKKEKRGKAKRVIEYDQDTEAIVNQTRDWIKTHIYLNDDAFLMQIGDLVKKQLRSSLPRHICKTLCDFAGFFIQYEKYELVSRMIAYAKLIYPDDPVIYCQEAESFKKQGKVLFALELYEEAIKKFPHDVVAYSGRAETLRELGHLEAALKQHEEVIKNFPHDVVAYCGRAETLRELGRLEAALRQYNEAIIIFPHDVVAYSGRAETLRELGHLEAALRQHEEVIKNFPHDVVAYCGRAETLRELGRLETALKQYEEAKRIFPHSVVAHNGLAETLRELGRLEAALKQYQEAIKIFPHTVVAYCGRAETLREFGRLEAALKQYEDAIKGFPYTVVPYCGRAETLRELDRLEAALKQYEDAIKGFPHDRVAYCGRAETLRELGHLEAALKQYYEVIRIFPHDVVAYNGLAETLRELGRLEAALKQYKEVIRIFPHSVVAYNGLAETLRELGRLDAALKQYEEAIRIFPHSVVSYNGLAETLRELEKLEEALQLYKKTIKQFPNDKVAKNGLLKVALQTGKVQDEWLRISKLNAQTLSDYISLHIYCMFLLKQGEWEEAELKLRLGLKCPFRKCKKYFAVSYGYLKMLKKQYDQALDLFSAEINPTPATKILELHALAAKNNKVQAKIAFDNLSHFGQSLIRNTLRFLDERYTISNQQSISMPIDKLDKEILDNELKLLLQT